MNICVFKLITGEEVLGEVTENQSQSVVVVKNPVGIAVVRGKDGTPNVGFAPFPIHAEQKTDSEFKFQRTHIVYEYTPAEDFITNYNQIFGSGIILPKQPSIITG
jgi:hypothetical protein